MVFLAAPVIRTVARIELPSTRHLRICALHFNFKLIRYPLIGILELSQCMPYAE